MKKTVTFGLLFMLILASCSILIEKRRYNKGLHVEIGRNRLNSEKKNTQKEIRETETLTAFDQKNEKETSHEDQVYEVNSIPATTHSNRHHETEDVAVLTNSSTDLHSTEAVERKQRSSEASAQNTKSKNVRMHTLSSNKRENGDAYIYGLGAMMALVGLGALRINRNGSLKCSKFAHNNPYLSKGLITLGYSTLGTLGYLTGAELYHLGTDVSDMTQYVLGTTMVITGASVHYYEKRSSIMVWNSFYKRKLGHLIIGASMFGSLVSIGNGMQENRPQYSPVGYVISAIHTPSQEKVENVSDVVSTDETEKMATPGGGGLMALYIFLAIIVIILTVIFTCAAVCSDMAFLAVIVGILGLALTVFLCTLAANAKTSD